MGVLGEMFPNRRLRSEAGEAGSGQGFRLGPIDLDAGVVELVPVDPAPDADAAPDVAPDADGDPDAGLDTGPDPRPGADAAPDDGGRR